MVRASQPEQHVDGGGLAGAVRTEECKCLARRDREVDPTCCSDWTVGLAQSGDPDTGLFDLGDAHDDHRDDRRCNPVVGSLTIHA
jgi:hypothetical protein